MASLVADGGEGQDRRRTAARLTEQLRTLSATAAVGLVVGLAGGLVGRLFMRLLVITTADDRLNGALTDDDAAVNRFTLGGTVGLVFFIGLAGIGLAWLYLGARRSLPDSAAIRAAVWAVLVWSVTGSGVFDPDGFDFTRLRPVWLGVLLFSALFLAMGALVALGVERFLDRYPSHPVALGLPLLPLVPVAPAAVGGLLALAGAWLSERFRAVRILGTLVMVGFALNWGLPTAANVIRILT